MAVKVSGFDHIVIKTRDIDRSLDFYCGALGLDGGAHVHKAGIQARICFRARIALRPAGVYDVAVSPTHRK